MKNDYQLRRWLMREVHGVDIPRKPAAKASALGAPKTPRNWRYLSWIRTLPCACCGKDPAGEAAHTGSDGGMRLKASDYSCVPLCSDCHTQGPHAYHRGRDQFEMDSLDLKAIVKRLNRAWFHAETRLG